MTSTLPVEPRTDRTRPQNGRLTKALASAAWAVSMAVADKRNRTRLTVMAVGIAMCAFALLAVATIDPFITSLMTRDSASQPSLSGNGPTFSYQDVSNAVDGELLKGTLLSGPPDAAAPAGTSTFPGAGELFVSPALGTALTDPGGTNLRALLPGTVIGQITASTLTSPQEWRYYQGVEALPADAGTATGWGVDLDQFYGGSGGISVADINPRVWIILITGVTVLMIPLLLFTAMAGRIGAADRDRRSATLRLMGASVAQLRGIVAAEVALASVAGLILAAAGYLTVRALAPLISLGDYGAQTVDVHPDPTAAVVIAVGVPVLAGVSALLGSRRAAIDPLGDLTGSVRRPTLWWRLILLVVTIGATRYVLDGSARWGGDSFGYGTYGLCLLVVLDIACVVAWIAPLTYSAASAGTGGGPGVQLARGRILRQPGPSTRPAAAVATVLASVIALMSALQLPSDDSFTAGETPHPYYGRVVDLSIAEWQRLVTDLQAVEGVHSVVMSARLPMSAPHASAEVATCDSVGELKPPGTVCTDGDVFGQIERPVDAAGDRFTVQGSGGSWSPPADSRNTYYYASEDPGTRNQYLLTPDAVRAQIPDLTTIPDTRVGVWMAPVALADARDAVSWLGWQTATVFTYSDYASDSESFSWVRVTLLVCAAFVLLLSALAQWLLAAEYVHDRRRSFALARASGVPTSTLTRSVMIGALVPVVVGVLVAVGFGSLLAWEIVTTRSGGIVSLDLTWLGIGCGATLLVSSAVALGTAARLRRTTGPAALRTE